MDNPLYTFKHTLINHVLVYICINMCVLWAYIVIDVSCVSKVCASLERERELEREGKTVSRISIHFFI